jgi:acetyl esterase/lipase
LRDEAIHYALRLCAAGVPTELHVYPDEPHAIDRIAPEADVSKRLARDATDYLRRAVFK